MVSSINSNKSQTCHSFNVLYVQLVSLIYNDAASQEAFTPEDLRAPICTNVLHNLEYLCFQHMSNHNDHHLNLI